MKRKQCGREGEASSSQARHHSPAVRYRLLVDNLSTHCRTRDLWRLMTDIGIDPIDADAHNREINRGFVDFASNEDLKKALRRYQGYAINQREMLLISETGHESADKTRPYGEASSSTRARAEGMRASGIGEPFTVYVIVDGKLEPIPRPVDVHSNLTLRDFRDQVAKYTNISAENQLLSIGEKPLVRLNETLSTLGIDAESEIHVKHAAFDRWRTHFSNPAQGPSRVGGLLKEMPEGQLQRILKTWKKLEESDFFDCYDEYYQSSLKYYEEMDGHSLVIQRAAERYFLALYDHTLEAPCLIGFGPKPGGEHSGVVCYVTPPNSKMIPYFVKSHLGGLSHSTRSREVPDEREIFLYILIHECGFGSEVHFFPMGIGTTRTLLIATVGHPNLILGVDLTTATAPIEEVLKLHLFTIVVTLHDMHGNNVGFSNGKPVIFDFTPGGFDSDAAGSRRRKDSGYLHEYLTAKPRFVQSQALEQRLESCGVEERMRIARECLREWDIASKLSVAERETAKVLARIKQPPHGIETRRKARECVENISRMLDFFKTEIDRV